MPNKELEKEIVAKAEDIIHARENEGEEAALGLWQSLDQSIVGKRNTLSPEVLDLVLQLEFFIEGHPESDLSDLQHVLYCARVAVGIK
jgi:hypothetical protein